MILTLALLAAQLGPITETEFTKAERDRVIVVARAVRLNLSKTLLSYRSSYFDSVKVIKTDRGFHIFCGLMRGPTKQGRMSDWLQFYATPTVFETGPKAYELCTYTPGKQDTIGYTAHMNWPVD
jgi:hypothetical protein